MMRYAKQKWVMYTAVLAASILTSFLLYGNTIGGEFVYDDFFFVDREELRDPRSLLHVWTQPYIESVGDSGGGFYRPVWVASNALNFIIFGESPVSFHVINIVLYGLVVFLVFVFCQQLSSDTTRSLVTASLFAFLPIHTEVVANIKSRDELLSLLFFLISCIVFFRGVGNKKRRWYLFLSGISFFLALLSKESVVLGPLIILFIYATKYRAGWKKIVASALPFAVVLSTGLLLRWHALGDHAFFKDDALFVLNPLQGAGLLTRVSTAMKIAGIYIVKTFVPYNLTASYDFNHIPLLSHPLDAWESLVGIVSLVGLIILVIIRGPKQLRWGAVWFLVSYSIISKLFFTKGILMAERLMFVPSVGLVMISGFLLMKLFTNKKVLMGIVAALCIAYSFVIIPRNQVWLTRQGFFEAMAADSPRSVHAHTALARGYFDEGELSRSLEHARIAYEIYQDHPPLLSVLGKLAYAAGEYAESYELLQRAVQLEQTDYDAHHFSCLSLVKLGRYEEAIEYSRYQRQRRPDDTNMKFVMAVSLYKLGRTQEALKSEYNWAPEYTEDERRAVLERF